MTSSGGPGGPGRAQVAESWLRSAASGVSPDVTAAPITLPDDVLRDRRDAHPLAAVFPLLDDVLGQAARECDAVMAVSDAAGQLLWVCGTAPVLRQAERIGFVEGSNWDERLAGTNAPGLSLALDRPTQVVGREHFRTAVQAWSCVATPVHDPSTQQILGVLDITGSASMGIPESLAMVRAAARMAEAELARAAAVAQVELSDAGRTSRPRSGFSVLIQALGRNAALLTVDDRHGHRETLTLSRRHSEIVVPLASTAHGLSGDELGLLLYADDGQASTLRAELNRLRSVLGEELVASRPYRLQAEINADWLAVEAQAASGAVRVAARDYLGPLLPDSEAPGIGRLRASLAAGVRHAVLHSGEPDLMSMWTRSVWGADDYDMWRAQLASLDPGSPLRALVVGQLRRLDRELGVSSVPVLRSSRRP